MRKSFPIPDILQTGGFALHRVLGSLFRVGFFGQCCLIAAGGTIALLVGSALDHSLILEGRNIGLLEHPAIWWFPSVQIVLPLFIRWWLQTFQTARLRNGEIVGIKGQHSLVNLIPLQKFLRRRDTLSRVIATLIYGAGFAAWVWNTYQNQQPGVVIPFDFWDSSSYPWGFWITRGYKLYLFCWLVPYIAMIQAGILVITLRFVRRARLACKLQLILFHPDGQGGLGFVASLISTPAIVMLLAGSLITAAAFLVHRAAAITPLFNLGLLIGWALIAYFLPILFLRSDIRALKWEALRRLGYWQQENYSLIAEGVILDLDALGKGKQAFDYFDQVTKRIHTISNIPNLKVLLGSLGLAVTTSTSILSVALKLLGVLSTFAPLKKPSL